VHLLISKFHVDPEGWVVVTGYRSIIAVEAAGKYLQPVYTQRHYRLRKLTYVLSLKSDGFIVCNCFKT